MADIQLKRNEEGRLPHLTKWSNEEPASLKKIDKGQADHWSKTKHKTVTLFTTGKDGKTHFFPGERFPHESIPTGRAFFHDGAKSIIPHHNVNGSMKNIGTKSFTELLLQEVNGNYPGDYFRCRKTSPSKELLKTNVNERAKDGFEYWVKEPKPILHTNKKWIGHGGNILGTKRK